MSDDGVVVEKRGRGRPVKRIANDEVKDVKLDDKKDTTVKSVLVEREDDNCEPTVKRGRGRPKGHTIIVKPKPVPSGLSRGRPPNKKVQYKEENEDEEEADD